MIDPDLTEKLVALANVAVATTMGAVTRVLHSTFIKGEEFGLGRSIAILVIAVFVGSVIGSVLPDDMHYRDGILLAAGFSCLELLEIINAWIIKLNGKALDEDK